MQRINYNIALQCAHLARDVYKEFSKVSFHGWADVKPEFITEPSTDTQLAILEDTASQSVVIVFRGTSKGKDWKTNLRTGQTGKFITDAGELIYPDAYGKSDGSVKMHRGFMAAYLSVRNKIHNYIDSSSATRYRIVGHSLGGALAQLCALDVQYNFASYTGLQAKNNIEVEAYTFGAPKVGNRAFVASYNKRVPRTWRVVNGWDAVSELPRVWQGYHHADMMIRLKRQFTWRLLSARVTDHAIASYIKAIKVEIKQLADEPSSRRENEQSPKDLVPRLSKS